MSSKDTNPFWNKEKNNLPPIVNEELKNEMKVKAGEMISKPVTRTIATRVVGGLVRHGLTVLAGIL